MGQRMRIMAQPAIRATAEKVAPAFTVQSFSLADGRMRYYVRCEWHAGNGFLLGAWVAPQPALHIVGIEGRTASYGFESDLPSLLNVLDLGSGRLPSCSAFLAKIAKTWSYSSTTTAAGATCTNSRP